MPQGVLLPPQLSPLRTHQLWLPPEMTGNTLLILSSTSRAETAGAKLPPGERFTVLLSALGSQRLWSEGEGNRPAGGPPAELQVSQHLESPGPTPHPHRRQKWLGIPGKHPQTQEASSTKAGHIAKCTVVYFRGAQSPQHRETCHSCLEPQRSW